MNPHSSEFTKTKEGYLVAIEEMLNLEENLPKVFYRLDIEKARELYNFTLVSGKIGFIEKCEEMEIEIKGILNNG